MHRGGQDQSCQMRNFERCRCVAQQPALGKEMQKTRIDTSATVSGLARDCEATGSFSRRLHPERSRCRHQRAASEQTSNGIMYYQGVVHISPTGVAWQAASPGPALAAAAPYWTELQRFESKGCMIGNTEYIAAATTHHQQLQVLSLSDTLMDDIGVQAIAQTHWPQLQQLDLSCNCFIDNGIGKVAAIGMIAANAANFPQLQHLNLSRVNLGTLGVASLFSTDWPLMRVVDLSSTYIDAAAVVALVAAVSAKLQRLQLSCNGLGDEAVTTLATAASKWHDIEFMGLCDVGMSDIGGMAIAAAAHQWPELKVLDLSYNRVTDQTASVLAAAAKKWPRMSLLRLVETDISEAGEESLVKSSQFWKHMHVCTHMCQTHGAMKFNSDGIPESQTQTGHGKLYSHAKKCMQDPLCLVLDYARAIPSFAAAALERLRW